MANNIEALAGSFSARFAAACQAGRPVIVPWEEANHIEQALRALALMLAVEGDHMSACDRIMGATHPCTCGAASARAASSGN